MLYNIYIIEKYWYASFLMSFFVFGNRIYSLLYIYSRCSSIKITGRRYTNHDGLK